MAEWHTQARAMKAADPTLTDAQIAAHFGVTKTAVWKARNPERHRESDRRTRAKRRERRRELDREYIARKRAVCELCGGDCGKNTGRPGRNVKRCTGCINSIRETRMSIVAGMWNDGWSQREIADALGYGPKSTPPQLSQMMRAGIIHARRQGYRDKHDTKPPPERHP